MASGDELLVVDSIDKDRDGLRQLFETEGYVVTAVAHGSEAEQLVQSKFFPAALVDLDADGGGLALVRFIRERSEQTGLVLLTGRRSFEGAVGGLRAGVVDVVLKRPDEITRLVGAVEKAASRYRASSDKDAMLREAQSLLEESLKLMLGFVRELYGEASLKSGANAAPPHVLLVDDDLELAARVVEAVSKAECRIDQVMSGGGALDMGAARAFDVVACRESLQDLPGSMVVRTLHGQSPGVMGLVYTSPGENGKIDRWDGGQKTATLTPFKSAEDLVTRIVELANEVSSLRRERLYLQKFRRDHGAYLQRYAALRRRTETLRK